jgi:hypothetical protein
LLIFLTPSNYCPVFQISTAFKKNHLYLELIGNKENGALVLSGKLYVCPQCGKESLSIHWKTYERTIIAFCDNCHFSSSFEPSKEAFYDTNKAWEEFIASYKIIDQDDC